MIGDIKKINYHKLKAAKKAKDANKMARKLLPEFFTMAELQTHTCVRHKSGKSSRPQADEQKLSLLLGECRVKGGRVHEGTES